MVLRLVWTVTSYVVHVRSLVASVIQVRGCLRYLGSWILGLGLYSLFLCIETYI